MSEDNPTTLVPPGKSDADPGTTPPTPATRSARIKPPKPYPDFPLFPHDAGVWAKKIRGKMHYFGRWDDPDAALKKYLEQKDDLHAGPTPASQSATEAATVKDVCNAFLNAKAARVESGELSQRMFLDYKETCDLVVSHFGKNRPAAGLAPGDFDKLREKMAKRWGPVRLGNVVQRVRTVFKYAHDSGLLPFPMRFGPGFCRPTKKTMRLHRAAQGPKLFTAEEVRRLIDAADVQVQAMLLLGINAGFGNTDCASLPLSALDLEHALIDFPRPKTSIARRCPLWPETVEGDPRAPSPVAKNPKTRKTPTSSSSRPVAASGTRTPAEATSVGSSARCCGAWGSTAARDSGSTRCGTPSGPSPTRPRISRPPTSSWAMKYRI